MPLCLELNGPQTNKIMSLYYNMCFLSFSTATLSLFSQLMVRVGLRERCHNTRFPLPILLYAGYSVKPIKKRQTISLFIIRHHLVPRTHSICMWARSARGAGVAAGSPRRFPSRCRRSGRARTPAGPWRAPAMAGLEPAIYH